jgi:hypothetical protein
MHDSNTREPDYVDEEYWYKMQFNYVWYAIKACCRKCATRKGFAWIKSDGQIKTTEYPDWLIKL